MKQITIAGRLGRDAVLRTTQQGDSVLGFSVAVDDRRGREKSTEWFDCSIWGKRGEALASHLTKGTAVAVSGGLGRREHEGRTYLTVRVDQVTLLGGGDRDAGRGGDDQQGGGPGGDYDDSIPFAPEWRL